MSHYTVSYEGLEGTRKQLKAIEDIIDWMGLTKFLDLTLAFQADGGASAFTYAHWANMVSLAGVVGYPARAWYEFMGGTFTPINDAEAVELAKTLRGAGGDMGGAK